MFFIHRYQVPKGKKVSYARTVCMIRPKKDEKNRTRITVGGDQLEYDGKVATETSSLETAKLHINSTISTPGAKYMCMDAGNFYLNTPLEDFQYMRFPVWMIPDEIMKEYDLYDKVSNGFVYVELRRGIYGLKESGILANLLLKKRLSKFGYRPVKFTHGL